MKIYLGGSMAGGRDFASMIVLADQILKSLGHEILTFFVVDQTHDFTNRNDTGKAKKIFKRDLELLKECDVAIMEISQPSHGVGYELAELVRMSKPILCLRHESVQHKMMSAMVEGNSVMS